MCVCVCIYTYIYIYIYIPDNCVCVCVCVYTYIYIYIYIPANYDLENAKFASSLDNLSQIHAQLTSFITQVIYSKRTHSTVREHILSQSDPRAAYLLHHSGNAIQYSLYVIYKYSVYIAYL